MAQANASQRLQAAWTSRGPLAWLLAPLALIHGVLVRLRQTLYRIGVWRIQRLPVPVIVVGNLIAGGAGKTPTVIAVTTLLRQHGWRPGIVSRGYGRRDRGVVEVDAHTAAADCGDEPRLLHTRTAAPVVVAHDRVAAARALLQAHPEVDVIVSDDGLQHLRLGRRVQVVVFDDRGAGNGWLLPAGPLREPVPRRVPPNTLVLYNARSPSTALPGWTARRSLRGLLPLRDWWAGAAAVPQALQRFAGEPVLAAAGTAQPQRFFDMLGAAGVRVRPLPLADHHDFATLPWPAETSDVIVTEKDAIKLDPARMGSTRVWVAPLDFEPDPAFNAELLKLLPPPPPRTHDGHATA
ncbi:MAG TPA: tetraacyldisaccharide 4'-kinase [Albitalea sp.]|uniref:tetraacyldisaccharide 4'-kinase n=1 Tax=Piscinibacter sp. TaxID=1903157 RepID=UPI002ED0C16E